MKKTILFLSLVSSLFSLVPAHASANLDGKKLFVWDMHQKKGYYSQVDEVGGKIFLEGDLVGTYDYSNKVFVLSSWPIDLNSPVTHSGSDGVTLSVVGGADALADSLNQKVLGHIEHVICAYYDNGWINEGCEVDDRSSYDVIVTLYQ